MCDLSAVSLTTILQHKCKEILLAIILEILKNRIVSIFIFDNINKKLQVKNCVTSILCNINLYSLNYCIKTARILTFHECNKRLLFFPHILCEILRHIGRLARMSVLDTEVFFVLFFFASCTVLLICLFFLIICSHRCCFFYIFYIFYERAMSSPEK